MKRKRPTKPPDQKLDERYKALWKVVDGAVADAFNNHPEYVAKGISERTVRNSINKRVVGAILSFALQRGA